MNQVYMHYKQDKKKIELSLLAIIVLMLLYGIYKNGLSYIMIGKMNLEDFLPLTLFPILSMIGQMVSSKTWKLSIQEIIEALLLSIMIPPRFSLIIYIVLILVYYLSKKHFQKILPNLSFLLVYKILTCLISTFFLKIDYQNIIEAQNPYLYSPIDQLFGRGVGNLGSTSILLMLVCFGVSMQDVYYKKELSISIITTYILLVILYACLYTHEDFLPQVFNSHLFFSAILLSSIPKSSPAEKRYIYVQGILTAVIGFVLTLIFSHPNGIYYSLFLTQVIWTILHQFLKKI